MKIDYRYAYKFCMNIAYKSTVTYVVTVGIFKVISDKFNIECANNLLSERTQ